MKKYLVILNDGRVIYLEADSFEYIVGSFLFYSENKELVAAVPVSAFFCEQK